MKEVEHFLSIQNELGETPIWVPEEKSLYWVDFIRNTIFRIDVKTRMHESFQPDMPVRGLFRRNSNDWLMITDAGLAHVGKVETLQRLHLEETALIARYTRLASNREIGPTPLRPAWSDSRNASLPIPIGLATPTPVITTSGTWVIGRLGENQERAAPGTASSTSGDNPDTLPSYVM